jgi:hypothetical protein
MRTARATLLGGLVGLAACNPYKLVAVGPHEVAGRYRVQPQVEWNRRSDPAGEVWTLHGEALDSLLLTSGLPDGDPLFRPPNVKDLPSFRSGMSENEVMEFVVDSLARTGAMRVEAANLRPASFGGRPGLRFELSYATPEGLEMQGLASAAVVDGRLYLVLFRAPRQHYFGAASEHVDRLIESIEMR